LTSTPIPFLDYKRIFNTIYSILLSEDAEMNHSCLFYSILGATILNKQYKINAKVYVGLAALKVDDSEDAILIFAEEVNGRVTSTDNGFHSWIETEDEWLIDFSAPQFPDILKSNGQQHKCGTKMLQKPISDMSSSPNDFKNIGEFFYYPNLDLTNEMIDNFVSIPGYVDLVNICNQWYRKPPRKMIKSFQVSDGRGNLNTVTLNTKSIVGSW